MRRWPSSFLGKSRYSTVARRYLPLSSLPVKGGRRLESIHPHSHIAYQPPTKSRLRWLLLAELVVGVGLITAAIARTLLPHWRGLPPRAPVQWAQTSEYRTLLPGLCQSRL